MAVDMIKKPTPDLPCFCVDANRKAAIRTVRTMAVDALWHSTAPADVPGWRDLMVRMIVELKGL